MTDKFFHFLFCSVLCWWSYPLEVRASELPTIEEFIIRDFVERWKPRLDRFGVFEYENGEWLKGGGSKSEAEKESRRSKNRETRKLSHEVVLLIHGLDEIGTTWDDMAPALEKDGHEVLSFCYPNDQSIDRSAALFRFQLKHLKALGVERLAIVAHSMGGLVTRDALTREDEFEGDLPTVTRIITIGTPNQGAPLASLRHVGEWREHMVRFVKGEHESLDAIFDGMGEASIDLLPDSPYLKDLNSRPLPKVPMTIIAGLIDDHGKQEHVTKEVLTWLDDILEQTLEKWGEWSSKLGDGVVPLESTKLAGVDDWRVVKGNHHTIVNHIFETEVNPPAVDITLELLK